MEKRDCNGRKLYSKQYKHCQFWVSCSCRTGAAAVIVQTSYEKEKDRQHLSREKELDRELAVTMNRDKLDHDSKMAELRAKFGNLVDGPSSSSNFSAGESPLKEVLERVPETLEKVQQTMKKEEKTVQESINKIMEAADKNDVKALSLSVKNLEGCFFFL